MKRYSDCPQVLREFLICHENIMGQSPLTISEYYLDLRMFLRFIKLMRNDMPISTRLDDIDIRGIDLSFIQRLRDRKVTAAPASARIRRKYPPLRTVLRNRRRDSTQTSKYR